MKANYQEMEHDLNKGLGFLFGMIGGVTKFVCDVPIHTTEYFKGNCRSRIYRAGVRISWCCRKRILCVPEEKIFSIKT
jgi:hypothetical protein